MVSFFGKSLNILLTSHETYGNIIYCINLNITGDNLIVRGKKKENIHGVKVGIPSFF